MNSNPNNSHEQEIRIDGNPINSKSIRAAILGLSPHTIVTACMEEITSGIKLNLADLPFYAAAFEILRSSISTHFNENDTKIYSKIMETAQVFTYTQHEHQHQQDTDTDEDESDE